MVIVVKKRTKLNIRDNPRGNTLYWGDLDGKTWTKWSISIWDIVKSSEERKLGHPAMFPLELCLRLIRVYSRPGDIVLDPFMGTGSTLVAAQRLLRKGIGFEIYDYYVEIAKRRLEDEKMHILDVFMSETLSKLTDKLDYEPVIIHDDARYVDEYLDKNTIDLVLTSPPYFNVHRRKRTSDRKKERPYGNDPRDLGNINDYNVFLKELTLCFEKVYNVLKPNKMCIVIVMDVRERATLFPLHIDIANNLKKIGFELQDIIIWDRRKEYNNIRPIGYPNRFLVNKVHEYIMIFRKCT